MDCKTFEELSIYPVIEKIFVGIGEQAAYQNP